MNENSSPNSGSDTVETKDQKDTFLLKAIKYFKNSATVVEQGVLLFIALLTNPEGSKVEILKPSADGRNGRMKLQGLTIQGFISFYDWQVDDRALFRGLKIAAVLNGTDNRLMDIQFPNGKSWREGTDLQRLHYVREELDGINPKDLDAYFQNLFNVVSQGKAIPKAAAGATGSAARTAAAAVEVAAEKATSRKEQAAAKKDAVAKLNGKKRDTQSNSEQQPAVADVVPTFNKALRALATMEFQQVVLELAATAQTAEGFAALSLAVDAGQEALAIAAAEMESPERISTTA